MSGSVLLRHALAVALLVFLFAPAANSQLDAGVRITKTVDDQTPLPGNPAEFTIIVTNIGPDDSENVEVLDKLPPGLRVPAGLTPFTSQGSYSLASGVWQVGDVRAGGTALMTIPALAQAADSPTCYENIAEITRFSGVNWITANDKATASVLVGGASYCAELVLEISTRSKLLDGCGRDAIFDLSVRNLGPAPAFHIEVALSGTPKGHILTTPDLFDELIFDRIGVGETATGKASWWVECEQPEQTADYTVSLTTNTVLSEDSVTTVSGQTRIPKTRGCDCNGPGIGWGSGCFIATAAYGSSLDKNVTLLREFRDQYLLTNRIGRALVKMYYRFSPPLAAVIRENVVLRISARALLTPIVHTVAFFVRHSR